MNENFVLRSGKHSGKTIAWVKENYPSYLSWVKENQPNMLKGSEDKPKAEVEKELKFRDKPVTSLEPNMDFWNEGPDPMSLPYLQKMQEKNLDN
jgi:hypothetical protein